MARSAEQRFEDRINRHGPISLIRGVLGPCHLWTGHLNHHGYGRFRDETGRLVMTHRWAYERAFGAISPDLMCDHLCRVRACANPEHIEPVTARTNTLRGTGLAAVNATVTHCPQGHPYDEANTYRPPSGGRRCRTCKRANDRATAHRERTAA